MPPEPDRRQMEVLVTAGPQLVTAEKIAEWLNDIKDIEEGVTGDAAERRSKRDQRRNRHMSKIGSGLSAALPKLHPELSYARALEICSQEVRTTCVGFLGVGLLGIFLKTLISWAICRFLDWYFSTKGVEGTIPTCDA